MIKINTYKNILIIDDDPPITQMLTMLLETRGYEVSVAHSAQEGLRKVSKTTDLILLDLVLPDQNGFEVCRHLKESDDFSQIPIIILSGKVLNEDVVEGLYLGADDYLTKPFEYEVLVARMEAVLRRGSYIKFGNTSINTSGVIISELRKIIDEELITPFFQPIFFLNDFRVLGVEALTRPMTGGLLDNPELLFKFSIQFGFYHDLELLAWKKAVGLASQHLKKDKLFLNCNPYFVEGTDVNSVKLMFDCSQLEPRNVILEITERSAVSEYTLFYEHLKQYREHGFSFAVDDVGGGYASLESIVHTKPEVVKIDPHIINNISNDPFKSSIVKFIVSFCRENNILSVAEGIENIHDLKTICELGVDAGQGYYLFKPCPMLSLDKFHEISKPLAVKLTDSIR